MMRIHVIPRAGVKVRTEDGRNHIDAGGQSVPRTSYYLRRIAAGDLVQVTDTGPRDRLIQALRELTPGDEGQWTDSGKPNLNYLRDVLNRRVSRKEVDDALKEMES
jgi:hypothetical protein